MSTSIAKFLVENASKNYISFHMPGHKGSAIYAELGYSEFIDKIVDCDITEIIGADNLFKAEGIIKNTAERYAELYNAKKSYLLVNGSSGGIISAILAVVPKGGKLIMARNSHKSIFNTLSLGDIQPVYAYSEMIEKYGITGEIKKEHIEELLKENTDASAVILPSPNYYGICSDIKGIADVVHKYGKILIVDQAHGAHLKFFRDYPKCAEDQGADIVINSTHKTLASFTGSAILNVCSERVDLFELEDKLQSIETSSPSYLLMASLDINADILEKHGMELTKLWMDNIEWAYETFSKIEGLEVLMCDNMDRTKINISMSSLGLDGAELELELLKHGIRAELITGDILMLMSGIGNTRQHFEKLYEALENIAYSQRMKIAKDDIKGKISKKKVNLALQVKPFGEQKLYAVPRKKYLKKLSQSVDEICASSIIPYPPGIPIVCPGEKITREMVEYVEGLIDAKEKVIGVTEEGCIFVGDMSV